METFVADRVKIFWDALKSTDEKSVIKALYYLSTPFGDLRRRFILKKDKNLYELLWQDGETENINITQLKEIVKKGERGQFYAGSKKCALLSFEDKDKDPLAFWIVYSENYDRALALFPFILALFFRIIEIREAKSKPKKESNYTKVIENLLPDPYGISSSNYASYVLSRVASFLSGAFSPSFIIVGVKDEKHFTVAIKNGESISSIKLKGNEFDEVLPDEFMEIDSSSPTYAKIKKSFGISTKNKIVVSKKEEEDLTLLLLFDTENKIGEEDGQVIRLIMTIYQLFLKSEKEKEEINKKRSELGETFKLVVKRTEIREAVLNSLEIGICLLTKHFDILYHNPSFQELLKINHFEIMEKKLLKSKEPGRSISALLEKVKEEKKGVNAPLKVYDKFIDVSIDEIEGGNFLIIATDRTEIEKELEERKHLFSLITHEIKNPLAAVLSASEMVYSERVGKLDNPQQKKLSEMVYKNAQSMRQILEDVSLYAKSILGTGNETLVPIKQVILKVIEDKKSVINAKEISIHTEIADVSIFCNPAMMETLLSNIIGNAIKYGALKGNVGIRVVKYAGYANLEVVDDGIGIPESEIGKIGEPFFRAENVRDTIAGTGFGLSIVKNIVSRLQGTFKILSPISKEDKIFIHSSNGFVTGTKVVITFPLVGGENAK
jgi:signal transduction histidine kinase